MRTAALERPAVSRLRQRIGAPLLAGALIIGLSLLLAVVPGWFAPYDPLAFDYTALLQPPSAAHPFGTDNFGRDVLSRVIWGYRLDMQIAFFGTIFPILLGCLIGALVGYYGGWPDVAFGRVVDAVITFPFLVLVIAIVAVLGPGLINMYIAVGVVGWVFYARLLRAEIRIQKHQEYAAAGKVMGYGDARIILRHLLPNAITPVLVFWMTDMALVILLGSSLGYLGLGAQPPAAEWGVLIADGKNFMTTGWWISIFPGLAIVLTGLGFSLIGDGIDLDLRSGEVLGLVGESGSGKSVTLRSLVRLVRAPGRIEGQALWQGRDLLALPEAELLEVRGKEIAMIFQEPMTALNPVLTVRQQIDENLKAHTALGRAERQRRASELLDLVGIPSAGDRLDDYPHQFSGGMRQRVMIAIALASEPRLLLADEPTTALDVTIQDQILKLLLDLRDRLGMSVILVTHDLGVVAQTCDRVVVMYAGRIMEVAPVVELFHNPRHAYTAGLLDSIPSAGASRQPLRSIEGTPPSPLDLPEGCPFAPRCDLATTACRNARPPLAPVGPDHLSACVHHDRVARGRRGA